MNYLHDFVILAQTECLYELHSCSFVGTVEVDFKNGIYWKGTF